MMRVGRGRLLFHEAKGYRLLTCQAPPPPRPRGTRAETIPNQAGLLLNHVIPAALEPLWPGTRCLLVFPSEVTDGPRPRPSFCSVSPQPATVLGAAWLPTSQAQIKGSHRMGAPCELARRPVPHICPRPRSHGRRPEPSPRKPGLANWLAARLALDRALHAERLQSSKPVEPGPRCRVPP